MEVFNWTTEEPHANNIQTLQEYIDEHCSLVITHEESTYAEGKDEEGNLYSIRAMGNGDSFNHRVEIEQI